MVEVECVPTTIDDPRIQAILTEVVMDEPFDTEADLVVIGLKGEDPIGLVAGKTIFSDWEPMALYEHVLLRPQYANRGKRIVILSEWWADLCMAKGITTAICGIPKDKERRLITSLAIWWGFAKYAETDEKVWYMKKLNWRMT